VLYLGPGCHRLIETLCAAAKLGAVVCPANWRQSAAELAYVRDDFVPKVVIDEDFDYEAAPADDPAIEVDPASPLCALYTAGFSGRPRAALLSHSALLIQALVTSKIKDLGPDTVYLACGPMFHVAALVPALATLLWGGRIVLLPRMDAEAIARAIEREQCTAAFLVAQTIEQLVALNQDGRYDLKSLRAAPGSDAWNQMVTRDDSLGGRRPGGYGQTECAGHLTFAALGGRPGPLAQARIVDGDGREVAIGEVGELCARGPMVTNGYLRAPAPDGWHRTGDLARRERDGSISFIGPKARLIKSGHENIYPAEVEACLRTHPAVADCAVIGVPDPKWQQSVCAVVTLRPGATVDAVELVAHCQRAIASYKKPRRVEFVDALPRRAGAIDYDALDARFGGGAYPGEA
jgi:long-chain acyl-CoA synthetase